MKVSKCQKFGYLILKTVTLVRIFKNQKYPEILKENVGVCVGLRLGGYHMPVQRQIHSLLRFQFLKALQVPQFLILNPQILGTY